MNLNKKHKSGFTIIEVVLVLAIAGLIFLMVFLALPALQRSQRDTQRKGDLSRVQAAINSYQSSHRGKIPPISIISSGDFVKEYLVGDEKDEFIDPSGAKDGSNEASYSIQSNKTVGKIDGDFKTHQNIIYYSEGATCNEDDPASIKDGQGNRKVALRMRLENGSWHCLNN